MFFDILRKIKREVNIMMWLTIIVALLIVSGVYTYARYTYHTEITGISVKIPGVGYCAYNGLTLSECVLVTENADDPYETVDEATTAIEAKGTPTFSSTATTDEGLYATEDDYGTSYYYRGAVEDNYVEYAGYIWRIVRVNGDGSVRLIYDGTEAHANGDSDTDRYYTTSAFNSSYNDNTYVGYMYGTAGSSTYDETHENTNDSTIKTVVDGFYEDELYGTDDDRLVDRDGSYLTDYLSDTLFCNDRSLYSGTGLAKVSSYYYGYSRLYTNKSPVLTCTNQNDEFTVKTTTLDDGTEVGNGDFTYPVGLITADEVWMAGGTTSLNTSYYLYIGSTYWTMTPSYFKDSYGYPLMWVNGSYTLMEYPVQNAIGARPVVNLSSDVYVYSGTGTMDDPYEVSLTKREIPSGCNGELSCEMLLNSTGESTVSAAKTAIEDKGTPTFSSTATTDEGLYAASDDYGTSYYYRGAVEDNYVSYAGYIWRIVRRNGDGSVRLIYDGTEAHANGDSDTDRYYTTSAFNSNYYSNAMVGYMYSDVTFSESVTTSTSTKSLQSYYYYYSDSYTFDESTGYYTLTSPTQQVWNSSLAGYYTCRGTSTCTSMYYISAYTNMYQGKYYTYTRSGSSGAYTESHGTSTSTGTFATRYYYGTYYSFNSTTGYYTLTGYAYNVYDGTGEVTDLTGYYTCGSASYSDCSTIYYIDSAYSISTANVNTYSVTYIPTTYDDTHTNTNSSTIKGVIDSFYTSKLDAATTVDSAGNKYSAYLSDTLFCNDKSLQSGTGIGKVTTYYKGYNRLYTNKSPILTCTNQNDRFTVSDTTTGNGDLTYPIGLITADEVAMAGGVVNTSNTSYYLYIGSNYWTMTPSYFGGSVAQEWYFTSSGSIYYIYVDLTDYGVRPVVNLSSEVLVSGGTGTKDDPYTLTLAN